MRRSAPAVALLLFGSGWCALTYQIAWVRMLRLVFGASTAASAAVLAIFMGGLGLGGLVLGHRADRTQRPLRFYGYLELGVAVASAASPLLIMLVRAVYIAVGGTAVLGMTGGTLLRLLLSTLVLGIPTVLMGGTLPAAVRAAQRSADLSRRAMGLLYGVNTLGAVAGTLWATFVALERYGIAHTVWLASGLNVLVALAALALSGGADSSNPASRTQENGTVTTRSAPVFLILTAAAVVGFAFLLMELVWYRMLAPLLGGSSYTFGLILAVALLGIGAGGLLYANGSETRRPTLLAFATTCVLEALCLVVPYALGDRVALLAAAVRPLGFAGFTPLVATWFLIGMLVIFPAALLAGFQFPLLVALLGTGEARVGREVGLTYASNTGGAIAGSLAGGFGLIPLLSAPGVWRAVVVLLVGFALVCVLYVVREGASLRRGLVPFLLGALALWLCNAIGPTAFWRHTPIGAGRFHLAITEPNDVRRLLHAKRRQITWEADGVESAVALDSENAYSFIIHGKSDGNAVGDAPTQVMAGLIAAILHPNPKRALVIGLGTGSTAGWLAQVDSIEHVDVVELEPAIRHVAEVCSPVNHDVLANPKVHLIIGDGRERLLTTPATYDVIFSEPSNPYRAGVASLFTQEFYDAVARRLGPDGVFAQWVQAYEVQPHTLRAVYATLRTVFPAVETWEVKQGRDLLLLARLQPQAHDLTVVGARVSTEPYRSALNLTWGVDGLDGLYTGFVADPAFARDAGAGAPLNTDDHSMIEFEFARTVGREGLFTINDMRALAATRGQHRPTFQVGGLDWLRVDELRSVRVVAEGGVPDDSTAPDPGARARLRARHAYASGNLAEARALWLEQPEEPQHPMDITLVAESLAAAGDARALAYADRIHGLQPAEAEAIVAQYDWHSGHASEARDHLVAALAAYRTYPWAHRFVMNRALDLAWRITTAHPETTAALFDALERPFAVRALDGQRLFMRANIGLADDSQTRCAAALAALEPWVPWEAAFLQARSDCYMRTNHPLAGRAQADFAAFQAAAAPGASGLLPATATTP